MEQRVSEENLKEQLVVLRKGLLAERQERQPLQEEISQLQKRVDKIEGVIAKKVKVT